MHTKLVVTTLAFIFSLGVTEPAGAKGCIRGALVGGTAGHYAGHTVLGAVGGCVVGRRLANNKVDRDREQQLQQQSQVSNKANGSPQLGYSQNASGPSYGGTPVPAQGEDGSSAASVYTGGAYHRGAR